MADGARSNHRLRLSTIAALTGSKRLGRTAVMKLMFLLQSVRRVPLGYTFRIYTYGPFDGQVLEDLRTAESQGLVSVNTFDWLGGSGYDISAGEHCGATPPERTPELQPYLADLKWVLDNFGDRTASDLEIIGTIIFVDRSNAIRKQTASRKKLAKLVHAIKPHHAATRIENEIDHLLGQSLLEATK